jgi:hypothetical protein
MEHGNLNKQETANGDLGAVSSRAWLFQYRSYVDISGYFFKKEPLRRNVGKN